MFFDFRRNLRLKWEEEVRFLKSFLVVDGNGNGKNRVRVLIVWSFKIFLGEDIFCYFLLSRSLFFCFFVRRKVWK